MATSPQGLEAQNPLLPLADPIDFAAITPGHVTPAIDALIAAARAEVASVAGVQKLSYELTLGALERATRDLERASMVCEHLESAHNTPELRAAWSEAQPKVSAFWSELPLSEGLYRVLKSFAQTDEARSLDAVRARHLKKTLEEFKRHGAELSPEGKARLTQIDVELSKHTTKFSQNVLDATNAFELLIDDEARLAGLPPLALSAARASAEAKGKPGFRFTLHAPSFIPAITHIEDPSIREALYRAYNERASSGELDNRPLIRSILALRKERANLLGFGDFADLVTADRMAKSGERAVRFLADLRERTRATFERERAALQAFAGRPLDAWDVAFYSEKQRKALFDLDEEALRPYFALESVLSGVFEILERLYGVRFVQRDLPTWHADVRSYHLVDRDDRVLAAVYIDLFPRDDKVQGAWMAPLCTAVPPDAHVAVVAANFTMAQGDVPALLSHREVETLFHELGHLMHQCLSAVPVRRLAGTSVAWDFVELPSQIMENWTWERESVDLFARHYETGERLPEELFQKLVRARNYRAASMQMQQIGYAEMDLDLHRSFDPASDEDPLARARSVLGPHLTAALPESFAMLASFGHLFAGPVGYAAGYYSYKWAEVLDADAFGRFRERGIFDAEVGRDFREQVLSRGDSEDPEVLYRRFRGREPKLDALLERLGVNV